MNYGNAYDTSNKSFLSDLFASGNAYNHNEAIYAFERSMDASNTAMQRSVADYEKAGFSPLAALAGGGASTPTSQVATASKQSGGINDVLKLLGTVVMGSISTSAKLASAVAAESRATASAISARANSSRAESYQSLVGNIISNSSQKKIYPGLLDKSLLREVRRLRSEKDDD